MDHTTTGTSVLSTSTLDTALTASNVDLQANQYIDFRTDFTYTGNTARLLAMYAPCVRLGGNIAASNAALGLQFGGTFTGNSQTYAGNVLLAGADRTLTSNGGAVTFNGDIGGAFNFNVDTRPNSGTGAAGAIDHNAAVTGTFQAFQMLTGTASWRF